MSDRRAFVLATVAAAAGRALAQAADRVWRIGYFGGGLTPADGRPPANIREALRDLGYTEGRNVVFVCRWADLKIDRLPVVAQEMVALRPDVLIAAGYPAADAARHVSSTLPIVVTMAGDPVATGLVASLAHPGANVTGVSDQSAELSAKRLEILKELRPNAARIAVIWNARNEAMTVRYREIERAAGSLRITVQPLGVREPGDFDAAFAAMAKERPDALLVVTDALVGASQQRVLDFVAHNEIPAMYEFGPIVRNGGLISYGPRPDDVSSRVAVYVDRILKGAKPADLPVEQATQFELVINQKTAKSLGVTVPSALLLRADEVIP